MNHSSDISRDSAIQIIARAGDSLASWSFSETLDWKTNVGIERDIEQFVDRNLVRVSALLDDTAVLLSDGRILGAAATSRAALETMAVVVEFFRKLQAAVKRADGGGIKSILSSFIFASFEFSEVSLQKTPNIMDAIRNAEKRQAGILPVYSILCEAVHPNWSGRIGHVLGEDIDWENATVQRLILSMAISASFSRVIDGDLRSFQEFVVKNRKNFSKAILF